MPGDALNPSHTAGISIPGMSTSTLIGCNEEKFKLTLQHIVNAAQHQDFHEYALYPVAEYITAFYCSAALLGDNKCFYINSQPGISALNKGDTPDLTAVLGAAYDEYTSYIYLWEVKHLLPLYWYQQTGIKVALNKVKKDYEQLNKYAVTLFKAEMLPPKQLAIFHSAGPYFSTLIFDHSQLDKLQSRDILQKDLKEFPKLLMPQTFDDHPMTPPKDLSLLNALKTFHRTWYHLMTPVVLFAGEPMFEGSDQSWRPSSQLHAALYKASVMNQPMSFSPSWLSPDEGDLESHTSIPSKKEHAMEGICAVQRVIMNKCRQDLRQIKHRLEIVTKEPQPSENDSPETQRMFERQAALDEEDSDFGEWLAVADTHSGDSKSKTIT